MKIVIVGAGISGLSTYIFLKKHLPNPAPPAQPHSVIVYEAYDTSKTYSRKTHAHAADTTPSFTDDDSEGVGGFHIGGGLALTPNGMNVVKRLDEDLFHDVVRAGHPITQYVMKNSHNMTLAVLGSTNALPADHKLYMGTVMVGRQALWRCFRQRVPDEAVVTKRISEIYIRYNGKIAVKFADGSPDVNADLVIGADGLKSIVRRAVFDAGPEGKEPYPPKYEYVCPLPS